jgi:hypothetical protein
VCSETALPLQLSTNIGQPITNMTNIRLGDVLVSVLAKGPTCGGFEHGQGDGLLRAMKIRSTPSSTMGSKDGGPMS